MIIKPTIIIIIIIIRIMANVCASATSNFSQFVKTSFTTILLPHIFTKKDTIQ